MMYLENLLEILARGMGLPMSQIFHIYRIIVDELCYKCHGKLSCLSDGLARSNGNSSVQSSTETSAVNAKSSSFAEDIHRSSIGRATPKVFCGSSRGFNLSLNLEMEPEAHTGQFVTRAFVFDRNSTIMYSTVSPFSRVLHSGTGAVGGGLESPYLRSASTLDIVPRPEFHLSFAVVAMVLFGRRKFSKKPGSRSSQSGTAEIPQSGTSSQLPVAPRDEGGITKVDAFQCFADLPPELRICVWKQALVRPPNIVEIVPCHIFFDGSSWNGKHRPCVMQFEVNSKGTDNLKHLKSGLPDHVHLLPGRYLNLQLALSYTNQEFRYEAEKIKSLIKYKHTAIGYQYEEILFFDFQTDFLAVSYPQLKLLLRGGSLGGRSTITKLVLLQVDDCHCYSHFLNLDTNTYLMHLIDSFASLKELYIEFDMTYNGLKRYDRERGSISGYELLSRNGKIREGEIVEESLRKLKQQQFESKRDDLKERRARYGGCLIEVMELVTVKRDSAVFYQNAGEPQLAINRKV